MAGHTKSNPTFWIILALVFLALLCWVTGLNFAIVPTKSWDANCCIDNLRQINAAAKQFAREHNKTNGEAINYPSELLPYFKDGKFPTCPSGGIYSIKKIGDTPTCSLGTNVIPAHILP